MPSSLQFMEDYYYYDYDANNGSNHSIPNCHYLDGGKKVQCDGIIFDSENSEYYEPGTSSFYVYLGAYIAATLFAGEFDLL